MPDNHSREIRHYNMARIKSRDTKPEEIVRKFLFSKGFRYRKNDKRFPGKPDIVMPKHQTVILVHGCFWHCHEGCPDFVHPKSNQDYWLPKLKRNRLRDAENISQLKEMGWRVIIIWECELKTTLQKYTLNNLVHKIVA